MFRILLRIPEALFTEVKAESERRNISRNQVMLEVLAEKFNVKLDVTYRAPKKPRAKD